MEVKAEYVPGSMKNAVVIPSTKWNMVAIPLVAADGGSLFKGGHLTCNCLALMTDFYILQHLKLIYYTDFETTKSPGVC